MKIQLQSPAAKKFISLYIPLEGRIISKDGREIAALEYRHSADCFPRLIIRMGDDMIDIRSDCRTGSKGEIRINGTRYGRFDCTLSHYPQFFNQSGARILHIESDSLDRRFLWAFRNGFSRKEAKAYAAARHAILAGPGYVLASIYSSVYAPESLWGNVVYPLMNEPDEQIWQEQDTETRLCILAGACWWLCYGLHYASKEAEHSVKPWDVQVNVPSTLCLDGRIIMAPEHLPPVNAKAEFLATRPVLSGSWLACSLLCCLIILPLTQHEFNTDCLAAAIYTSIIPLIWILVCRYLRNRSARKIRAIEQQLNGESDRQPG